MTLLSREVDLFLCLSSHLLVLDLDVKGFACSILVFQVGKIYGLRPLSDGSPWYGRCRDWELLAWQTVLKLYLSDMACLVQSLRPSLDSRHTAKILVHKICRIVISLYLFSKLSNTALGVIHLLLVIVQHTTPEMLRWIRWPSRPWR